MTPEDTLPWYRQFWPWFLILIPASTVVAGIYTLMLAINTSDSLVTSADGGMDVVTEQLIAAERRAAAMGLDATVVIDPVSGAISADLLSTTNGEWPKTLELLFSHPTISQLDRSVTLTMAIPGEDGSPRWVGHIANRLSGRWYVILKASDDWRLYSVWTGTESIRLRPASAADDNGGP